MARTTREEKAVEALETMANSLDYSPELFAALLLQVQNRHILGNIVKGVVTFLRFYRDTPATRGAHGLYDPGMDAEVAKVDLTEFDR